ncbi:GNAT family N-acetyltransferase [uncultured Flavobacterium sp.]|uniref:GNAT family N-acetyltransferase n=1 Tax=uncultured Flavobacterium sp. TaxID=165435 RepID=UPI0025DBEE5A|nr:GNAT family N-acetyltransferase [uncultured Flavobacterium sp.]
MPTIQNLSEIKAWMIMEKGTFFNWSSIESAFKDNCLVIATIENEAVGFFALTKKYPVVTIDLAEIHPLFRKNNIATRTLSAVIDDLKRQKFYTLDLMCAPASSENIWRKMGFTDMPKQIDPSENKMLCLTFGLHLQPTIILSEHETLEIWDDEPHITKDNPPKWIYNLSFKKGTRELEEPVLLYANYDWRVRWIVGNKTIKDCKLKYLYRDMKFGNCLFIDKLPVPPAVH